MRRPVALSMRWLGLGVALLLVAATGARDAAASTGGLAPLSLSQALAEAQMCGPGFVSAQLSDESLRLERRSRQAALIPRPSFGTRTDLHPEPRTTPAFNIQWDFLEYISMSAQLPHSVKIEYNRPLWPPDDPARRRALAETELQIRELTQEHLQVDAYRAVVDTFAALAGARADEELAGEALRLARERAAAAQERYANGQIGVREWQGAQEAQRQAEVALRRAQSAVLQNETRLVRLMWSVCYPERDGSALAGRPLVDDLPWDGFIEDVQAVLAQPQEAWQERVLELNVAYQEAMLEEFRQALALVDVRRSRGLSLSAGASVTIPITGEGAGRLNFDAHVSASIDLSEMARVKELQAALNVTAAGVRGEQARLEALDAVTGAQLAIGDAEFARDVAERGVRQAADNLALVQRRWEAGFATALELAEARLALMRAEVELAKAETSLRLAWLSLGVMLGVPPP